MAKLTEKEKRQVRQIKKRQAAEKASKTLKTKAAGIKSFKATKRAGTSERVGVQVKKNKKLLKKYKRK
jgi:hypothetical protein